MNLQKSKQAGFTLIELLIVIVVIAILAAISVVTFTGIQQQGRDSRRAGDSANIVKLVSTCMASESGAEWKDISTLTALKTAVKSGGKCSKSSNINDETLDTLVVSDPAHSSKMEMQYQICAPTGTADANVKDNITGIKIVYYHEKDGKPKAVTAGEAGNCKAADAD